MMNSSFRRLTGSIKSVILDQIRSASEVAAAEKHGTVYVHVSLLEYARVKLLTFTHSIVISISLSYRLYLENIVALVFIV